jgi:hypothetical protein
LSLASLSSQVQHCNTIAYWTNKENEVLLIRHDNAHCLYYKHYCAPGMMIYDHKVRFDLLTMPPMLLKIISKFEVITVSAAYLFYACELSFIVLMSMN